MFASDFEPCAVKSSLEKTVVPGRGPVNYPQQKTAIPKIARRRRTILRVWVFSKLGFVKRKRFYRLNCKTCGELPTHTVFNFSRKLDLLVTQMTAIYENIIYATHTSTQTPRSRMALRHFINKLNIWISDYLILSARTRVRAPSGADAKIFIICGWLKNGALVNLR